MSPARLLQGALVLLLIATIGACASSAKTTQPSSADAADLPPQQAARLCIVTGRQLQASGYERDAIQQYERARLFLPSADVSAPLAVLYDRQGMDAKALAEYQRAVASHPHDAAIENDFACFYMVRGEPEKAEVLLRAAVRAKSPLPRSWINLGIVLANQGRSEESLAAFEHVLTPAQANCNVGILLAKRGDTAHARDLLASALQNDPSLHQAKAVLAWIDQQNQQH